MGGVDWWSHLDLVQDDDFGVFRVDMAYGTDHQLSAYDFASDRFPDCKIERFCRSLEWFVVDTGKFLCWINDGYVFLCLLGQMTEEVSWFTITHVCLQARHGTGFDIHFFDGGQILGLIWIDSFHGLVVYNDVGYWFAFFHSFPQNIVWVTEFIIDSVRHAGGDLDNVNRILSIIHVIVTAFDLHLGRCYLLVAVGFSSA